MHCSFYNPWESRTDAVVDLVYFTLAHLRRPPGAVLIPKGTEANRCDHLQRVAALWSPWPATVSDLDACLAAGGRRWHTLTTWTR